MWMHSIKYKVVIFIPMLGILLISPLCADTSTSLVLQPESSLWLEGDSSLHPFTSTTDHFQANGTLINASTAPFTLDALLPPNVLQSFDVSIPVRSLTSKESGLDKNMYKDLKADACPEIAFHLNTYHISPSTSTEASEHLQATGVLSIDCTEQPVMLNADITADSGRLRVQGQYALLMSDYGVKPPTMMMGTIKVKDSVHIHFDLKLGFAKP